MNKRIVILSGGQSPKSKDLRDHFTGKVNLVRRFFDSLALAQNDILNGIVLKGHP